MNQQETSAVETTNRILSKLQNGGSPKKEIKQIVNRAVLAFSIASLIITLVWFYLGKYHSIDSHSIFPSASNTILCLIGFAFITFAFSAIGQISQLPEKPLGENIYKMYADYINRRTPGQQNVRQYTVTVTENINAKRK
jgi:hypothetical protein